MRARFFIWVMLLLLCACGSESAENSGTAIVTVPTATTTSNTTTTNTLSTFLLSFLLSSDAGIDAGTLPVEYTCDGVGISPALSWSNPPVGTKEFALMMTTLPGDGTTKWNWVLYGLPATTSGLSKNSSGAGILGSGSHGTIMTYDPPCSQGPGAKLYTVTLYALSASPVLPGAAGQVTGELLTAAIQSIILDKATLILSYARQ